MRFHENRVENRFYRVNISSFTVVLTLIFSSLIENIIRELLTLYIYFCFLLLSSAFVCVILEMLHMTYFLEDLSEPSGSGNTIIYAASLIHGTCLINKSDKTGRNPLSSSVLNDCFVSPTFY